jgi:hypothetical protein
MRVKGFHKHTILNSYIMHSHNITKQLHNGHFLKKDCSEKTNNLQLLVKKLSLQLECSPYTRTTEIKEELLMWNMVPRNATKEVFMS